MDEIKKIEELENKFLQTNRDAAAEYMAEVLMDDDISTYKMYEDIASNYLYANDDYRKGVDMVLSVMLNQNFETLTESILAYQKEGR